MNRTTRIIAGLVAIAILAGCACGQELEVQVRPADVQETEVRIVSSQIVVEGEQIGEPTSRESDPVDLGTREAALVQVSIPGEDLSSWRIKIKTATADPVQVEPGWFLITEPGDHLLDVNAIRPEPVEWLDESVELTIGEPDEPDEPDDEDQDDDVEPGSAERVLLVYESEDLDTMAESQREILSSSVFRQELRAAGIEFRVLDQDVEFADPSDPFRGLLEREIQSLPWIVIAGDRGLITSRPLPMTIGETRDLLGLSVSTVQAPVQAPRQWVRVQVGVRCQGGICYPVYQLQEVQR